MSTERSFTSFQEELAYYWRAMPGKAPFFLLLGVWLLLFHFQGNSTLGYVNTPSLFSWIDWMYDNSAGEESHGRLIPFGVVALLWWKRKDLLEVKTRPWWPAVGLLLVALAIHGLGFVVQQSQISVVGFFLGIYALMGIIWGPRWMAATFFPMCLFLFCIPMKNVSEFITFPLRLMATKITAVVCQIALGINIIQDGTRILDGMGRYHYEIAAACSGLRSLTATAALSVIVAFMSFKSNWRRLVIIASAAPLAVASNVLRLTTIIVAAETFGQKTGDAVHDNSWLSMVPYVPAILGILLLARLLREPTPGNPSSATLSASQPSIPAAQSQP